MKVRRAARTEDALDRERVIEGQVRTIACPVCGSQPKRRCVYPGVDKAPYAHTGRFNLAVAAGLVSR